MRDHQTAYSVANRVQMLRRADRAKAFLIVEGSQDCSVYRLFACPARCDVQWGFGRENALGAGQLLRRNGFSGFVIAVDQDEWVLNGGYPKEEHVVWTDGRDLESTLIFAGVADRLLANYAHPESLKDIERSTKHNVLEHLIEWCGALGAMRWVIRRGRLGLPCKHVDAFASVNRDSMQISIEQLADSVLNGASGPLPDARPRLKKRLVTETIHLLVSARDQKWLYCSGHDLCIALASGLREDFGKDLCEDLTADILEAAVRTAYAWSDFETTKLHGRIRTWEGKNPPFRILADRPAATVT